MRRADHPFIYSITQYHGDEVARSLQSLPLIHLSEDNLSHLFDEKAQDVPDTCIYPEQWDTADPIRRLPFDAFCFLMTVPFAEYVIFGRFSIVNDSYSDDGFVDVDLHIAVQDQASMDLAFSNPASHATNTLIGMRLRKTFDSNAHLSIVKPPHVFAKFIGDKQDDYARYFKSHVESDQYRDWVTHSWGLLLRFCKYLEEADLYPVKIRSVKAQKKRSRLVGSRKPKKNRANEPYRNQNLPTIRYLNVLPTKSIESKGGGHASPKPHRRRSTRRTLTHPRFANHPKYGIPKAVAVKGSFVGPKEAIIAGNEYRVLEINESGQVLDY